MQPYSILMFCFAGMTLLFAAILAPGNADFMPRRYAASMKNDKDYVKRFAKVLALTSLSPLLSGIVAALIDINRYPAPAVATLIVTFILCMRRGARIMKPREKTDENNSRP